MRGSDVQDGGHLGSSPVGTIDWSKGYFGNLNAPRLRLMMTQLPKNPTSSSGSVYGECDHLGSAHQKRNCL